MLTNHTRAAFAERLAALDSADLIAAERAYQSAYEARYDRAAATLAAMSSKVRTAARRLERLGGPGCLSGSLEWHETCEALAAVGIAEAGGLFEWDRRELAR